MPLISTLRDSFIPFILFVFLPSIVLASEPGAMGVDEIIEEAVQPISSLFFGIVFYKFDLFGYSVPLILLWLMAAALFFTFYLGFVNLWGLKHSYHLIRGKYYDKTAPGSITHFQALTTELSGTVGLGNIAGVAVAITIGGPGAVIWMVLSGFFGMSLKFAECALGVKYRNTDDPEHIHGGPMYYLSRGLREHGMNRLGYFLGVFFAICCIGGSLGGGNMFQANQAYQQFVTVTGGAESFFADKGWLFGLILGTLVGVVIIGGIRSIARVASKIVPFMGILYFSAAVVVIAFNIDAIGPALGIIFSEAFSTEAGLGGLIGAMIAGVQRAAFSNEAGIGSAAIAHSAVKTRQPMTEGFVAMVGPVFDTMIICTMTALVIVISGVYETKEGIAGVALTSEAFATALPWFPVLLSVAVILFAFSTMIAWSYYGAKAVMYIFDESRRAELAYKVFFCLCVIVGSTANLTSVINFTDAMVFAMAVPNLIGLYILAPTLKSDLRRYWKETEADRLTLSGANNS